MDKKNMKNDNEKEEPKPMNIFLRNGVRGSNPPKEIPDELLEEVEAEINTGVHGHSEVSGGSAVVAEESANALFPDENVAVLMESLNATLASSSANGGDAEEEGDSWIDRMNEAASERHQ